MTDTARDPSYLVTRFRDGPRPNDRASAQDIRDLLASIYAGNIYDPRWTSFAGGAKFDGTTDDTAALQAAHDAAAAAGGGVVRFPAGKRAKITSSLVWDHGYVALDGNSASIDASAVVGYAIKFQTANDTNQQNADSRWNGLYSTRHKPIRNLNLFGKRTTAGTASGNWGILFGDLPGTIWAGSNVLFQGVTVHDFEIGLTFGNHGYIEEFEGLAVYRCDTCLSFPAGLTDAGERIAFRGCTFFGCGNILDAQGGSYFFFDSCSFDYFTGFAINAAGGAMVVADKCHFETNSDGDYWVKTSAAQSRVTLTSCSFWIAGTRSKELFSGGNSDGGVTLDGACNIAGGTSVYDALQTFGTGYVYRRAAGYHEPTAVIGKKVGGPATNQLVDYQFSDTSAGVTWRRADWCLFATPVGIATIDTTTTPNSLKISGFTGALFKMVRSVPCGPGSSVSFSFKLKSTVTQAADSLIASVTYFDQSGRQSIAALSGPTVSQTFNSTNAQASFAEFTLKPTVPAPPGTAFALITVRQTASVDGSAAFWIQNPIVEVVNAAPPNLDYFTEGSVAFVPSIKGSTTAGTGTYTTNRGSYTKVGNRVFMHLKLTWTAHTGTGNLTIGDLPFLCNNNSFDATFVVRPVGIPFTGPLVYGGLPTNTVTMNILQCTAAGVESNVPISATGTIYVSGHYDVN